MEKIKIKINNANEQKKLKLLEILSSNEIYATKIITVSDGFIVLTASEQELD